MMSVHDLSTYPSDLSLDIFIPNFLWLKSMYVPNSSTTVEVWHKANYYAA